MSTWLNHSEKKRICFILPTLKYGGQERAMSTIANYAAQNRPDLDIILVVFTRNEHFYHLEPNIKVHEPEWSFNIKRRLFYTFKTALFIRKSINTIAPYTILSFGEGWNSFVILSLLGKKFRIFVSDRCNPYLKLPLIQRNVYRFTYNFAEGIIAQSNEAKEVIFKKTLHQKIYVSGNPIRKISTNNQLIKENIILNIGRFVPTKNQIELIKIFISLNRRDWKLVFLGDGLLMQDCIDYVRDNHWTDSIIFPGKVRNVDEYLLRSKIFAFTSISEGFPNVLLEAMSASLPVITYNFKVGANEIVSDNRNGFVVEINDIIDYTNKLLILMDDEEMRTKFGQESVRKSEDYADDKICQTILDIITA
jgi:GalNAc-alpha-(1->4)-GalNAc-alpha-(1->3)-diNAcBac-PP-undecaprenol alpha-1,4-N-acetyl-D-galactosaminyltransferase